MRMHIIRSFVFLIISLCDFFFVCVFRSFFLPLIFLFCLLNTNYDTYNAQGSRKTNIYLSKVYQKLGAR